VGGAEAGRARCGRLILGAGDFTVGGFCFLTEDDHARPGNEVAAGDGS